MGSGMLCMSPGLTDESVYCVIVEVDLSHPDNIDPTPQCDEGEFVTVKRVELKEGLREVMEKSTASMPILGAFMFALGLEIGIGASGTGARAPPPFFLPGRWWRRWVKEIDH